jgi:hypothetical protein|tara:strand:+ start:759 stop:1982 length:1224 start_codon:yes stop_codon:yes gene_type:complete
VTVSVLQRAERLFRSGEWVEAIDSLEAHLRTHPLDKRAAGVLGKIYVKAKKPELAAYWLKYSLGISGNSRWRRSAESSSHVEQSEIDLYDLEYTTNLNEVSKHYNPHDGYGADLERSDDQEAAQLKACPGKDNVVGPDDAEDDFGPEPDLEAGSDFEVDDEDLKFFAVDDDEEAGLEEDTDELLIDADLYSESSSDADFEEPEELPSRLTDLEKAQQLATALAVDADWAKKDLGVLAEILAYHRNSGKTREALESLLLNESVDVYELVMLHEIRLLWGGAGYSRYYFRGKAIDGGPAISWVLALKVVRQLQASSAEEVLLFIEDCFQQWSDTRYLIYQFAAFSQYLKHIIEHMQDVSERCGQPPPPFIDFDLFGEVEGTYGGWSMHRESVPYGYNIISLMPGDGEWR